MMGPKANLRLHMDETAHCTAEGRLSCNRRAGRGSCQPRFPRIQTPAEQVCPVSYPAFLHENCGDAGSEFIGSKGIQDRNEDMSTSGIKESQIPKQVTRRLCYASERLILSCRYQKAAAHLSAGVGNAHVAD